MGNRPTGPKGPYDGSYTANFEYVKGSGDLNEYNGLLTSDDQYYYNQRIPFCAKMLERATRQKFFEFPLIMCGENIASGLYIVKREWKQTKSLQPVLGNGNFRPDVGLRPRFALSRFFIHSVNNKKESAEREEPIT